MNDTAEKERQQHHEHNDTVEKEWQRHHEHIVDRRDHQHHEDLWFRILRIVGALVYPVLIINMVIFLVVMGTEQQQEVLQSYQPTALQKITGWVHLHTFMPIMIAGLLIGITGLILNKRRARRHYDDNRRTPLMFTVISIIGLVVYFLF